MEKHVTKGITRRIKENWTPFLSLAGLFIGLRVLGKPSGSVRAHFEKHSLYYVIINRVAAS